MKNKPNNKIVFIALVVLGLIILGIKLSLSVGPQIGNQECIVVGSGANKQEYCCGYADSVCPATFGADCSNSPDIDCIINISGFVFYKGYPKANVTVKAVPLISGYNIVETKTDTNGGYFLQVDLSYGQLISDYLLVAEGPGLDSRAKRYTLFVPPPSRIEENFTLYNSTCNAQCVDTSGLCSYVCLGYSSPSGSCSPINETILEKCDRKPLNSMVLWKKEKGFLYYATCCEGQKILKIPISYGPLEGNITAITKQIITAKLGDTPVNIVILTWK